MKRILTLIALLASPLLALAQVNNSGVKYVATAPSGACSAGALPVQVNLHDIWVCDTSTHLWTQSGGSGSGSSSAVAAPAGTKFVFKGDSLTYGYGLATPSTQSYPAQFGGCTTSGSPATCTTSSSTGKSYLGTSATVVNLGVPAETCATALANYTAEVHPYCASATPTVPVYLHFEEGINDIPLGTSAADITTCIQSYWAAAVADGCTVTASTLTPTTTLNSTQLLVWNTVNTNIRASIGKYTFLDDMAKFVPDPTIATWYQGDGVHYTAASTAKIADFVNGLWSGKNSFQPLEVAANTAQAIGPQAAASPVASAYSWYGITSPTIAAPTPGFNWAAGLSGYESGVMWTEPTSGKYYSMFYMPGNEHGWKFCSYPAGTTITNTATGVTKCSLINLPTTNGLLSIGDGTQGLEIGAYTGGSGYGAIYPAGASPGTTNWYFLGGSTQSGINNPTASFLAVAAQGIFTATASAVTVASGVDYKNANGVVIPSTATGNTGAGKVVLSTGTGFSGTCGIGTTLTVVNGIITGCV